MPAPLFDRARLDEAFAALSDRLVERDTAASVVLFGDAAMMFAFDARSEVSHVDAKPTPRGIVLGAARDAGTTLGLPAHWINDQAASALAGDATDDVVSLWTAPNLEVVSISAEQLLAMRALSPTRPVDLDDIALLAASLGIVDLIDVEVLVAEIFPGRSLNAKTRTTLEALF